MTVRAIAPTVLALASLSAAPAFADDETHPTWTLTLDYSAEIMGPVDGAASRRGALLDNFSAEAMLDLERAIGWRGASFNLHLLSNSGGEPNQFAGTLEGISNIEVSRQRGKLFEAWIDQKFYDQSLVVGFYDLNREFYATDSSGLLLAPPFGIGSEIAATGPNGPSIFPSTAFGGRWRRDTGDWYAQAAVLDATAGVLGDPDDISVDFDNGALLIAEAGLMAGGKTAFGVWRYTEQQDDVRFVAASGAPAQSSAFGAYVLAERTLQSWDGGGIDGFVRAGLSDGDTTEFIGGVQTGLLWSGFWSDRPDAQASVGLHYGALGSKARENIRDTGAYPARGEFGIELTYADEVAPGLSLQPDLQVIWDAGGDRDADPVVVLGLRANVSFSFSG